MLLQGYCGITQYHPLNRKIALPLVFGLVFTLLVSIITKESLELKDVMLAFSTIVCTIMFLYPFIAKAVQHICRETVKFSYSQLVKVSIPMAVLLCMVLGFFPIAQGEIPIENAYFYR